MNDVLYVAIPAFNERTSLEEDPPAWLETCSQQGWQLFIVDGSSLDGTEQVLAAQAGHPLLSVCRHRSNRGYGNALKTGLFHTETSFAVTMDADGQHRMEDAARLLEEMIARDADLVIGARTLNDTSGAYRRLGKALIRLLARLMFSARIQDSNSGFKLYRTETVRRLLPWCPGSTAFSDVVTRLHLNLKLRVIEVSIETQPRIGGCSTINTMTALETLIEIVNVIMWFRTLEFLLPLAAVLILVGVGRAIPFLLAGTGMSGMSPFLIMSGMMVGILGLLAEQLAHLRRVEPPDIGARRVTSK